jgi:hypothetical protein
MARESPLQQAFAVFFGSGKGSGIAVMFFVTGLLSAAICLAASRAKGLRSLRGTTS